MEYLKDFDFQILYYLGKANVVVDALSRKRSEGEHKQVARLWTIARELVATNPVLQLLGFWIIYSFLMT